MHSIFYISLVLWTYISFLKEFKSCARTLKFLKKMHQFFLLAIVISYSVHQSYSLCVLSLVFPNFMWITLRVLVWHLFCYIWAQKKKIGSALAFTFSKCLCPWFALFGGFILHLCVSTPWHFVLPFYDICSFPLTKTKIMFCLLSIFNIFPLFSAFLPCSFVHEAASRERFGVGEETYRHLHIRARMHS